MIRRPPRSTLDRSSAASDVYKRQGEWHLKVDAEDDSGLVLYTGETEVQVFAGFTSQVYLTLQPTGSGAGSIYINVTWGDPGNSSWQDYPLNPMIESSNNYYAVSYTHLTLPTSDLV